MEFNLADLWERVADAIPDHEAIVCGDRRLTYAEADERANRLAHHLAGRGIGAGDHVALYLYNGTEYLEGMLAAFKLRAVPINVNYRYGEEELRYLLDDADARAVVFHREFAPTLAAVRAALPRLTGFVVVDDESGVAPPARRDGVRSRARIRLTRTRFRQTLGRRPVHPLHRWHHRHAEGRDVAGRGHLLRRVRRREPRRRADRRTRADRRRRSTRTDAACPRARSCTAPRTGWRSPRFTRAAPS